MFSTSKPSGSSMMGGSLFGGTTNAFQQNQAQPQQQASSWGGQSAFGQMNASTAVQPLGASFMANNNYPHEKPVLEQMLVLARKWDPNHPQCELKTYLYNKVDENTVPHYRPGPGEDEKAWEEALAAKPAPGYMPVLARGFPSLRARLVLQRRAVADFSRKLHEINACLDGLLARHDLEHSTRAVAARRRHALLAKRCLALATRVQVVRNRGFALAADEDELQQRLRDLERRIQDPALSARLDELWSRLITQRGYAEGLQVEIGKQSFAEAEGLGEEVEAKAKKILEDYEKQLQHLRKEVNQIKTDYEDWEKDHKPSPAPQ